MTFGDYSISRELYDWLYTNIPEGSTILEFGSGEGTAELVKRWDVWSVEHDPEWVGRYHDQYIHAPLGDDGWYARATVALNTLYDGYDCVIIDGPPNQFHRKGVLGMLLDGHGPLKPGGHWVIDDCHEAPGRRLARGLANAIGSAAEFHDCADGKAFAVVRAL